MSHEPEVPSEGIPDGSKDHPVGLTEEDREALRGVALDSIRHGLETGLALDVVGSSLRRLSDGGGRFFENLSHVRFVDVPQPGF